MYQFLKRIVDIIGSLIGIILFSPIMIFVSVYVWVVSPGASVIINNKRVGKNGKEFHFYKFRSMIPDAQKWLESQPELFKKYKENNYKLDPDPRLIKGGKFLRKYSFDELPQFFNILKGDMSIVGPRAYLKFELKEQQEKYPQPADDIKTMLTAKPGLTGLWQISGRSSVGFVERIKMDAEYARNRSIFYDILIIMKTPLVVIFGKGAY